MAARPFFFSKHKPFPLFLLTICLTLTLVIHTTTYNFQTQTISPLIRSSVVNKPPYWYQKLRNKIKNSSGKLKLKLAFVDAETERLEVSELVDGVTVKFGRVAEDTKWEELFPEWVDEDGKWGPMKCPEIPMPRLEEYGEVDVVVARVPDGVRDVYRLQVNLVVANVLVNSGWEYGRELYVVFVGSSGPMWEIFRCDDLVWHEGDYRIYKPDMRRLKQKVDMPVGSCKISPLLQQPDQQGRVYAGSKSNSMVSKSREAYVTVLHSSETYVCGAIALAQSIIQTNSTKDLVLLADDSISVKSLRGLKAAGWKIKRIERIRSPHAKIGAYNEYNYSKLRIWQLTEYEKVIFIDADLIVLKNIDDFFSYPQITAVGNDRFLFNSGVMLVEPSKCMFNTLMEKKFTLGSYNGGDQGFLNEAFTWWHRWHSKLNHLKVFQNQDNPEHDIPENLYTIHYLGLKPWMCYRDYDCNWDMLDRHLFASDAAHRKWWQVYETMPRKLKPFCDLTKQMDARIRKWREKAKNASFPDGHWKIKVKDRRRHVL